LTKKDWGIHTCIALENIRILLVRECDMASVPVGGNILAIDVRTLGGEGGGGQDG